MSIPSEVEVERQADRVHGSGLSARLYDPFLWWGEKSGLSKKRDRLLEDTRGEVLEIGAGTGLNLAHYPAGLDRLVLTEPEEHKAALLLKKAADLDIEAEFVRASAEALPFDDDSFDTVVATLVFCTVGEPEQAIAELKRVLRPGGPGSSSSTSAPTGRPSGVSRTASDAPGPASPTAASATGVRSR